MLKIYYLIFNICIKRYSHFNKYFEVMPVLRGWRYAALIGGLVGAIAITIYPIIIDPMLNPDKYSKDIIVLSKSILNVD